MPDTATQVEVEAPRKVRVALPENAPEWINAFAGVGMLLIGLATLWTTIRVSGLEDYFRSELAMRNQMITQAGGELRGLQDELVRTNASVRSARETNATLNAERGALEGQLAELHLRGRTLTTQNQTLARQAETMHADIDRLGKENAMRDLSNRLLGASTVTIDLMREERPRVSPVDPGSLILVRLIEGYERRPSENPQTQAIFAQLAQRCSAAASTPLEFGPMPMEEPSAAEYAERNIPPAFFLTPAAARTWERQRDAYNEGWGQRYRAYGDEVSRRTNQLIAAQQTAWDAIYNCAANIIGASNQQY